MSSQKRKSARAGNLVENYIEVTHALARHEMELNGDRIRVEVGNPQISNKTPKFLRVRMARQGMNFKVIQEAKEMGLEVGDVFQLTRDHSKEKICVRFDPVE